MWEVGFWLHWQLWGTEVFQSRKWLDLPCGTLAHPDNSPHCFEHPGSPQAPTEGSGATSERRGRENLLVQAARTGFGWRCVTSTEQNRAKVSTKTFRGIVSLKIKMRAAPLLLHLFNTTRLTSLCHSMVTCYTSHWITQQEVDQTGYLLKKNEYSIKQTNQVGGRGTVDCNNRGMLHVVCIYFVGLWFRVGI